MMVFGLFGLTLTVPEKARLLRGDQTTEALPSIFTLTGFVRWLFGAFRETRMLTLTLTLPAFLTSACLREVTLTLLFAAELPAAVAQAGIRNTIAATAARTNYRLTRFTSLPISLWFLPRADCPYGAG